MNCIVNSEIPDGPLTELYLRTDSIMWDDEMYYYISSETQKLSHKQAMDIIKKYIKLDNNDWINTIEDDKLEEYKLKQIDFLSLDTGHFTISIPNNWEYEESGKWHYYYDLYENYARGGYLAIMEISEMLDYAKSLKGEEVYNTLNALAYMISEKESMQTTNATIHGLPAVAMIYNLDESRKKFTVLVYNNGYFLCVGYSDESNSIEDIIGNAKIFYETIESK